MDFDVDESLFTDIPADIIHQILGKLPFPNLVRLRAVCKRWNDIVFSMNVMPPGHHVPKCVPVHFWNDELTVYNSHIKAWERHSLAFFQDHVRTTRLELVAAAGGLMCFETDRAEHLIVCNPISKVWRLLLLPSTNSTDDQPFRRSTSCTGGAPMGSSCEALLANATSNSILDCSLIANYLHPQTSPTLRKRRTIVGLLVDSEAGTHYKLVVASLRDKSVAESTGSTLIYDSLTDAWTRAAQVPEGEEFSDGQVILCKGVLFCLVKTETFNGELFRYDVKGDRWSTLSLDMSVMRCQLVEHCGRVLLVRTDAYYSDESAFRFFQLYDEDSNQWMGCGHQTAATGGGASNSEADGGVADDYDDLSTTSLEEIDLVESVSWNLDAGNVSEVSGQLKSTGRGRVLGRSSCLYVVKPPYEDGLRKKRMLLTVIDLSTGSCEALRELIVSRTNNNGGCAFEKHLVRNSFHLFSASVTIRV